MSYDHDVTMIRTDDRATKSDVTPEANITSDRQVVKLQNLGNLLEPLLELCDLLEMVSKLDDRRRLEHSLLVDDELAMLNAVDIRLDEQQVGAALHGQESASRNIHTVAVLEELDGITRSRL